MVSIRSVERTHDYYNVHLEHCVCTVCYGNVECVCERLVFSIVNMTLAFVIFMRFSICMFVLVSLCEQLQHLYRADNVLCHILSDDDAATAAAASCRSLWYIDIDYSFIYITSN